MDRYYVERQSKEFELYKINIQNNDPIRVLFITGEVVLIFLKVTKKLWKVFGQNKQRTKAVG